MRLSRSPLTQLGVGSLAGAKNLQRKSKGGPISLYDPGNKTESDDHSTPSASCLLPGASGASAAKAESCSEPWPTSNTCGEGAVRKNHSGHYVSACVTTKAYHLVRRRLSMTRMHLRCEQGGAGRLLCKRCSREDEGAVPAEPARPFVSGTIRAASWRADAEAD